MQNNKMKTVYTVVERDHGNGQKKSYWVKLGIGFVNRDGSINLKLDGAPTNGQLQVRDYESAEEREARFDDSQRGRPDSTGVFSELS